jgi:predicted TIM-barrel fold metal-dependent hydrolase
VIVNSADSHVLEPVDLFTLNVPAKLRDRAPRTVKRDDGREIIYLNDEIVFRMAQDLPEAIRADGHGDPVARIKDLDNQGVWGELIFPSIGLWVYLATDPELAYACARVYNDWLSDEFMKYSPRFAGAALIPTVDPAQAVKEMERVKGLGYQAVNIPVHPIGTRYNDTALDVMWAAATDLDLNVCIHVGTGTDPIYERGAGAAVINYTETFVPAQRAIEYLVAGGALDRHPDLQVIVIEGGASWLPSLMERMDEGFRQHGRWVDPKLSMLPGEFIRRQVHTSFQHDRAALSTLHITGVEAILFGTDYPHLEGTYPNTPAALREIFEGVPDDIRAAVSGGNLAKLIDFGPAPV